MMVACMALALSLLLASFQFPARAQEKERPVQRPDLLSHDRDRWALHLLPGGRAARRADASPAARISLVVAHVRAALRPAFRSLSPDRARLPGFGHSDWPDPKTFAYTFDHLAEIMNRFTEALGLSRYTLYMQDYGGPVGFRMALAHPERVQALIVQNAVAHNEGLGRAVGAATGLLGRSRRQRKRAASQFPVAGDDARPPCRKRSGRGSLRPRSLDRRVRVPEQAGTSGHPDRPLLRLSNQRRGLPQVAGVAAREPAAASCPVGQIRPVVRHLGTGSLSPRRRRRPKSMSSTPAISRSTPRRIRLRGSCVGS